MAANWNMSLCEEYSLFRMSNDFVTILSNLYSDKSWRETYIHNPSCLLQFRTDIAIVYFSIWQKNLSAQMATYLYMIKIMMTEVVHCIIVTQLLVWLHLFPTICTMWFLTYIKQSINILHIQVIVIKLLLESQEDPFMVER